MSFVVSNFSVSKFNLWAIFNIVLIYGISKERPISFEFQLSKKYFAKHIKGNTVRKLANTINELSMLIIIVFRIEIMIIRPRVIIIIKRSSDTNLSILFKQYKWRAPLCFSKLIE